MSRKTLEMKPNWIIVPVRGQLDLTAAALDSFLAQSIEKVNVLILDNGRFESDETEKYIEELKDERVHYIIPPGSTPSVSNSWNFGLRYVFDKGADYCLVCNNDVLLREDTYEQLLKHGGGFVTAVGSDDPISVNPHYLGPDQTPENPGISWQSKDGKWIHLDPTALPRPHPDFSCYVIRKDTYEKIGPFDQGFEIAFCEDWDYHCRLHLDGIEAVCIDIAFYHVGSATIRRSEGTKAGVIAAAAGRNRDYFATKWGFRGATDEYSQFFKTDPSELQRVERYIGIRKLHHE